MPLRGHTDIKRRFPGGGIHGKQGRLCDDGDAASLVTGDKRRGPKAQPKRPRLATSLLSGRHGPAAWGRGSCVGTKSRPRLVC